MRINVILEANSALGQHVINKNGSEYSLIEVVAKVGKTLVLQVASVKTEKVVMFYIDNDKDFKAKFQ